LQNIVSIDDDTVLLDSYDTGWFDCSVRILQEKSTVKFKTRLQFTDLQTAGLGLAVATALAACGSDSAAPVAATPPPAATIIQGVVAVGAALGNADIVVKDADAATADVTTKAGADGSFSADVSVLKAPFVVSASGTLNGEPVNIVAVVPAVSGNANNTANVTTLTNAIASLIAPGGDISALNTPATLASAASAAKVSDATALVVNTLKTDPEIATALGANFNPLTTVFSANGTGIDSVLDKLSVEVATTGVSISNNTAALTSTGAKPAPAVLTAAQTATPTTAPTLSASVAASSLPTAVEMGALAKKYQDCLALPIAQRVTLNGAGDVTAVSAICNYAPAGWSSNGRSWAAEVGQFTFARNLLDGAKAGAPTIAAVFSAANNTSANEFKHPVCNTATCVDMIIPMTTASGQPVSTSWTVGKVNGAWEFVGNRRPYRLFVEQRLQRKIAANPSAASGSTTPPYFFKDRFESSIRLTFDLTEGSTSNIRAVRWTGPGLPAAGIVQHRSQRCGTDDRMPISNQEGLLTVNNSASTQTWTSNGGIDYIVSASNLDGSVLARPVPTSNWATTAAPINQDYSPSDVTISIPAYSIYKAEIFTFANTTNVADEVVFSRTGTPYENASVGPTKAWPTLSATFVDAYLKPTGTGAGVISSIAPSMAWTNPAGNYVSSSYLFAQNFVAATNSQSETTTYGRRTRLDFRPAAYGDSSASGKEFASVASGTSLSTSTALSGTNPNPRCTNTDLVELTTTNGAYREAGLGFRGSDRKFYNAITFWQN
jgi:hypothetical protein